MSSNQSFYLLVGYCSDRGGRLSNHVKIAQTADPPSIILFIDMNDRRAFAKESSEVRTNSKYKVLDGTFNLQDPQQADVSVVQYKDTESHDSQRSRHTALNEAFPQDVQDAEENVKLSNIYLQCRDKFLEMMSKFQIMWNTFLLLSLLSFISKEN